MKQIFFPTPLLPASPAHRMNAEEDTPKQWTLRDCIDYALEHNITIQRNRISAESAQEDVKTARRISCLP